MRGPFFYSAKSTRCLAARHHRQDGFTALELVLVVAVTAIVVALGISMYRTHSVQAQIAASLEEAVAARRLVVAAFEHIGTPPPDAAATGIDETAHQLLVGTYVESLEIFNGRIDLRFGQHADSAIAGKVLSLTPFETVDREVVWVCGNEPPGTGLSPLGFAGGTRQAVQTSTEIEDRFLPPSCR